jgi:hypothetical protein
VRAARAIRLPSYLEPRKLPVFRTVLASYWLVARNLGPLCRVMALPLAAMVPLLAIATWLVLPWLPEPPIKHITLANELASWTLTLVQAPFLAAIAVAWHRFVLLQDAPEARLRLNAPVWKYAGVFLALHLVIYIPMLLGKVHPIYALFLSFLGMTFFFLMLPRLSLVLPATAIEANLPFDEAWWATRSNTLRLAFASILCTLLPLIPLGLVGFLLLRFERASPVATVVVQAAGAAVGALIAIIAVTFLSLTYRFFIRRQELDAS